MADYLITFDGGSRGNGTAAAFGYGSYQIKVPAVNKQRVVRCEFGIGVTNNEAEYRTLIAALDDLLAVIKKAERDPRDFSVEVRGDSALVIHQSSGAWQCKALHLMTLRDQVQERSARFGAVTFTHQSRAHSVAVLGH